MLKRKNDQIKNFTHFRPFTETGLAYVAVLILLAIMATLAMAFLFKAGTLTSATTNRLTGMQAGYLAEAAANHALWRLLNDPGFPADQTVYYMHDLAGGRYGYKVRKPTLTTFATVAAVGAAGAVETRQSYVQYLKPYDIITAYGRSADQIPEYRRLLGATWVDAVDTVDIGSDTVQWMVLKGCPIRKEVIMGTVDKDDDINLAVWSSTSWGNLTEFTQDADKGYRCFDVAYESQSGNALMVGMFDASTAIKYMGWDGTGWVPNIPTLAFNLNESSLVYLTMASNPQNDEILVAAVNSKSDLQLVQWDGSLFNDLGVIENSTETKDYGSAAIVYEQQSGDGLILWNKAGAAKISYRIWNGVSLSPENPLPTADFDEAAQVIWAAADPTSDYILVAAVDSSKDLNVAVWDGNAWVDSRELSNNLVNKDGQIVDVAWEHAGTDVVVAWAEVLSNNVYYFKWQKGTALADHAVQTGFDFQNYVRLVRLYPISGSQKIVLLASNAGLDLLYSLWIGNGFVGDPPILLEPDFGAGPLPFDIVESGVTYTGGSG